VPSAKAFTAAFGAHRAKNESRHLADCETNVLASSVYYGGEIRREFDFSGNIRESLDRPDPSGMGRHSR
jgi:hypothetical protein